jgi:hypothetical protein
MFMKLSKKRLHLECGAHSKALRPFCKIGPPATPRGPLRRCRRVGIDLGIGALVERAAGALSRLPSHP